MSRVEFQYKGLDGEHLITYSLDLLGRAKRFTDDFAGGKWEGINSDPTFQVPLSRVNGDDVNHPSFPAWNRAHASRPFLQFSSTRAHAQTCSGCGKPGKPSEDPGEP